MTYNYLVSNPKTLVLALWGVSKTNQASSSNATRELFAVGWHPLTVVPFVFVLLIFFVVHQALYRRRWHLIAMFGVLLAASVIPGISFYAVILTLGGFFVTLTMLCYLFLLLGARASIRWLYTVPVR